jgi:hypothetical protein
MHFTAKYILAAKPDADKWSWATKRKIRFRAADLAAFDEF